MRIVTRAEWRARPPQSPPATVPITARTALCVHHDGATPITVQHLTEAQALMRKDQSFHMDGRGWADIGYNYLVISSPGRPVDGAILEGRGRDVIGAHCQGHNTPWIGVQVAIGGGQVPSRAALASVRWLHDTAQADAGHPLAMVGHRDGFATECPGAALYSWITVGAPAPAAPSPVKASTPIAHGIPTTPPTPIAQEDDMVILRTTNGHHYITNGLNKREMTSGSAEQAWLKAGIKFVPMDDVEINAIPVVKP